MNIQPTFTQDSQACAGVRFTVRTLNQYQRALRDAKIIDARVQITELAAMMAAIPDPDHKAADLRARAEKESRELTPVETLRLESIAANTDAAIQRIRRGTLDHRMGLIINTDLKPAYIRASLLSIEGLEIGGQVPKEP